MRVRSGSTGLKRSPKSKKEMEILGIEPKTSSILGDLPANEAYYHCTISPSHVSQTGTNNLKAISPNVVCEGTPTPAC